MPARSSSTVGTSGVTSAGAGTASTRDDPARVAFRRARFHGGVWLSYLAGGVLGAFIALHWDLWSLTLPLAVLAVLIVLDPLGRGARA
jgi:uncharacterized membrane protein YoaK (UPF0700 family)